MRHLFALQALGFLLDVFTLKKFSADFVNQIIKHTLSKIFELAMSVDDGHVARQQAVVFLRAVTTCDVFKDSAEMRFVIPLFIICITNDSNIYLL
jgi:hypothetical protein